MKSGKAFFLTAILSLSSFILVYFDTTFTYRWTAFFLYILSLLPLPIFYCYDFLKRYTTQEVVKKIRRVLQLETPFLIISLISFFFVFFFLKDYPYVSSGDEVRDGGLNARQLLTGELRNLFGWGRYEAHGLIIPTLSTPFYLLFPDSVFTYRIPAAIFSFMSSIVMYVLAKKVFDRKTALLVALVFICFPIQMYFARTQIVVILNIFLSSLMLLFFWFFTKKYSIASLGLLGLIVGFSAGFHAAARPVVFGTLCFTFLYICLMAYQKGSLKRFVIDLFLLFFTFLIGYGPRLLFTTYEIFFHVDYVTVHKESFMSMSTSILSKYWDSLGVYFGSTVVRDFNGNPFMPSKVLSVLFVIGFFRLIFLFRNMFVFYIIAFLLVLPFTNSAASDCINCSHRVVPLVPFVVITIGFGIHWIIGTISRLSRFSSVFGVVVYYSLLLYTLLIGFLFFTQEAGSKNKSYQDFMSMHIIYSLKSVSTSSNLCLYVSQNTYSYLDLMHVKEQYQFFLPSTKMVILPEEEVADNAVYITKSCSFEKTTYITYNFCQSKQKFICPINSDEPIKVHMEKDLIHE